jgi:hypothetical protein
MAERAVLQQAGEIDKPDLASVHRAMNGRIDGTQIHMLSFLGEKWGSGAPRFTIDQVVAYTKKIRDLGDRSLGMYQLNWMGGSRSRFSIH